MSIKNEVIKVSSKSKASAVAGALASEIRNNKKNVELQVIGAAAVNQAMKAIAIARGYVVTQGLDLVCKPSFVEIHLDGQKRTALKLVVSSQSA